MPKCCNADLEWMSDEAKSRLSRNSNMRTKSHFPGAHIRHEFHHMAARLHSIDPRGNFENLLTASSLLARWHLHRMEASSDRLGPVRTVGYRESVARHGSCSLGHEICYEFYLVFETVLTVVEIFADVAGMAGLTWPGWLG